MFLMFGLGLETIKLDSYFKPYRNPITSPNARSVSQLIYQTDGVHFLYQTQRSLNLYPIHTTCNHKLPKLHPMAKTRLITKAIQGNITSLIANEIVICRIAASKSMSGSRKLPQESSHTTSMCTRIDALITVHVFSPAVIVDRKN